jgi:hypothetical protein
MPHWAPPAPTSRSGPEGIYWGELEVSRIYYGPKSPNFGGLWGAFESKSTSQTLVLYTVAIGRGVFRDQNYGSQHGLGL